MQDESLLTPEEFATKYPQLSALQQVPQAAFIDQLNALPRLPMSFRQLITGVQWYVYWQAQDQVAGARCEFTDEKKRNPETTEYFIPAYCVPSGTV